MDDPVAVQIYIGHGDSLPLSTSKVVERTNLVEPFKGLMAAFDALGYTVRVKNHVLSIRRGQFALDLSICEVEEDHVPGRGRIIPHRVVSHTEFAVRPTDLSNKVYRVHCECGWGSKRFSQPQHGEIIHRKHALKIQQPKKLYTGYMKVEMPDNPGWNPDQEEE
jgi:hypothetical protein